MSNSQEISRKISGEKSHLNSEDSEFSSSNVEGKMKEISNKKSRASAQMNSFIDSGLIRRLSDYNKKDPTDFDVGKILEKETITLENIAHNKPFSITESFDDFRKRLPPSGLIKNYDWEKIMEEIQNRPGRSIAAATDVESNLDLKPTRVVVPTAGGTQTQTMTTPIELFCFNCEKFVETHVMYENGRYTYIAAFICCCVLPFLILCAWVPFVYPEFQDVKHECPSCHTVLRRFKKM